MTVSMVLNGVEIIRPNESPDAWQLALLIKAILMNGGNGDESYLAKIQTKWLNLPRNPAIALALRCFVLGMDVPDDTGIFAENHMDALQVLKKRAHEILAKPNPWKYIQEQVLYAVGVKQGRHPADLAMLKGKGREVSLDSAAARAALKAHPGVSFTWSGVTTRDLKAAVAGLEASDSPRDRKLARAILDNVGTGRLAPTGADAKYKRIDRNKGKLRGIAQRIKRAKKQKPLGCATIIGERLLAASSESPVKRPGLSGGLTYKPANMSFDEGHPTPKRRPGKVDSL